MINERKWEYWQPFFLGLSIGLIIHFLDLSFYLLISMWMILTILALIYERRK